jgi:hypothetical protein
VESAWSHTVSLQLMLRDDPSIQFLLDSSEPAVRYWTLVDLLDEPPGSPEVEAARQSIPAGTWVQTLLAGQKPGGGFKAHPYQKWSGAHWRLVSLVELGIAESSAANQVQGLVCQELDWLLGATHRSQIQAIEGRVRRCASQEGNALAVCSRLGLVDEPRVRLLAESLIEWQWPDGGWNCDKNPPASHSSFHESLIPLWGLIEFSRRTQDPAAGRQAAASAGRTIEFFLNHYLFRSSRSGSVIHSSFLKLQYPPYWHYDILQACLVLSRFGPLDDPRCQEALDLIAAKRRTDGLWRPEGYYWNLPQMSRPDGKLRSGIEVVDWGRGGPNPMLTLNALRALKAAGRVYNKLCQFPGQG